MMKVVKLIANLMYQNKINIQIYGRNHNKTSIKFRKRGNFFYGIIN